MHKNFYRILGVNDFASHEEIRAAYRRLAKQYHPDKNFGNKHSEELFKEIQAAYAVLSNPSKRKRYDLRLKYGSVTPHRPRRQHPREEQRTQRPHVRKRPPPQPRDNSERTYIGISFLAAVGLLYFMILFSEEEHHPKIKGQIKGTETVEARLPALEEVLAVKNDGKGKLQFLPTDTLLCRNISDSSSGNTIRFINSFSFAAVVCLVQKAPPHRMVRNHFFDYGDDGEVGAVPKGEYYLKVFYGKLRTTANEFAMKNFQVFWTSEDKKKTYRLDSASYYKVFLNYYSPSENNPL